MPCFIPTTNPEEKAHDIPLSYPTCACGTEAVTKTTGKQNLDSSFPSELNQRTGLKVFISGKKINTLYIQEREGNSAQASVGY